MKKSPAFIVLFTLVLIVSLIGSGGASSTARQVRLDSASEDGTWLPMFPQVPFGHIGVHDPVRDRMLVIGETVMALPLSGSQTWTELNATGTPAAVQTAIYDPVRDRVVTIAGDSETWTLSLGTTPAWTQLAPGGTPPRTNGTVAIYDPARDRMLVFALPDGVWELSLSGTVAWTELAVSGTPPPGPFGYTVIYDPVRDRAVVFGGDEDYVGATWALSLSGNPEWAELATIGTAPMGLEGHSAIYDPVHDRMVVFGGRIWGVYSQRKLLALSLSGSPEWTELVPEGRLPQTRAGHAAIFDPARARLVIYGGDNQTSRTDDIWTDTWVLSLGDDLAWIAIDAQPSPRNGHTAIYDPVRNRMLVFAGTADRHVSDPRDDLPVLSLPGTPRWDVLNAGASPEMSSGHRAIYDPSGDRMVVFGGYPPEAWQLSLSETPAWAPISAPGEAPSWAGPTIYDPLRDRMLVANGVNVFALSLSANAEWSSLSPSGTPPSLDDAAVYDPVRDRMLVIGGSTVWAVSLAGTPAWHAVSASGTPPSERTNYTAIYDPVRDRLVVFGGNQGLDGFNDVWALSLDDAPAWTLLSPGGMTPPQRYGHSAIYDPVRDRMIVYGGIYGFYFEDRGDTWALEWGNPIDTTPPTIAVQLDRDVLWPANHKLVEVCATVQVADNADAAPTFSLSSITAVDGKRAVDAANDIQNADIGSADLCYDLRATRNGTGDGREYRIVYQAADASSNVAYDTVIVRVPMNKPSATRATSMTSVHPNPFNPQTTVDYSLESTQRVVIAIYDVRGLRVRRLEEQTKPAGDYHVTWNGADDSGRAATSGIYFVRMSAGSYSETRKIVMLK